MNILGILDDFVGLFYPNLCLGCGEALYKNEKYICTKCLYSLPKTNFHKSRKNMVSELFWGKVPIQFATSYSYFHKKGVLQNIILNLKYKGEKEVGMELGKHLGRELKTSDFASIDTIIPVPLHKKRLKKRGYNQSEWIAKGISEIMGKPIDNKSVIRTINTETQTKKTKAQRWENVKDIFQVKNKNEIINKHVLLIDDIITTGSTLEACASVILKEKNTSVSIATLGVAGK